MPTPPDPSLEFDRLRHAFRGGAKPVLWIGDELGVHADPPLPTFQGLIEQARSELWPTGPVHGDPREFVSAYRAEFKSQGKLAQFVEAVVRPRGRQPKSGEVHAQIARLVAANAVEAVLDTNYDLVLRRACDEAGASFLSSNVALPADGRPRYWTLRGDCDDVMGMMLDDERNPWGADRHALELGQLEVYLRQRPVVFVGSSLQDARILDWLVGLDERARKNLHGLVAVVEASAWAEVEQRAKAEPRFEVLVGCVVPALLENASDLLRWLGALADEFGSSDLGEPAEPKPLLIGRDDELAELRQAVLAPNCRVALVGEAGVGKSTLASALRYDAAVIQHFGGQRFFVSLSGVDTADAVLGSVAAKLGVIGGPLELASMVAARLASKPTLLVLDNFETAWHRDQLRAEALVGSWSMLAGLALIVTIRGMAWPSNVLSARIAVERLPLERARDLFLHHAPDAELGKPLDDLLGQLSGIPLAIGLLAIQGQGQSVASLAKAWARLRVEMVPEWATALELSFESPRMTSNCRDAVGILAELPGGVALDDYDAVLGESWPGATRAATGLGLAFERDGRLQMHALFRETVRQGHRVGGAGIARATEHYLDLARELGPKVGRVGGREAVLRLSRELPNIEVSVLTSLDADEPRPAIEACLALRNFGRFTGGAIQHLLEAASKSATALEEEQLRAQCLERLGDIALARSEHDRARLLFEQATPLYLAVGDLQGQANCIMSLGDIALERSEHDRARLLFEQATPLYLAVGDLLGQANCIMSLGDIALARSEHDRARQLFEQALSLYRQIPEPYSIGNTLLSLSLVTKVPAEREALREQSRQAWLSIDRADLVTQHLEKAPPRSRRIRRATFLLFFLITITLLALALI